MLLSNGGIMAGDFKKAMRRVDSQLKHKTDESLADLRSYWEKWDEKKRLSFKKWVNKLEKLNKSKPSVWPHLHVRMEFSEQVGPDKWHTFSPPLTAVVRAIECWEKDEPYVPNGLGELVNG